MSKICDLVRAAVERVGTRVAVPRDAEFQAEFRELLVAGGHDEHTWLRVAEIGIYNNMLFVYLTDSEAVWKHLSVPMHLVPMKENA